MPRKIQEMGKKPSDGTTDDLSTQEKIKEAARQVFTRKGYAATRTRDIAEEAGINLALLNYYFRSKEKLFHQIMLEKVQQLFGHIAPVVMNPETSLETKVEQIVSLYIDMITLHPDLPIFVLSEIRNHPDQFATTFKVGDILRESDLVRQLQARRPDIHPIHFLLNIMSMTLFPFIARPVFKTIQLLDDAQFHHLMQERKQLIPLWVKTILDTH